MGGYCNKCVVAIALAWLLSFSSILYTRLVPADIFPWNTTSLPWHIEYMFQAMFYMVLGYMFRHNMEAEFDKYNTLKLRIVALLAYLVLVFVPFFGKVKVPMVGDILYHYLTVVVGIATLILIAKEIKANRYINYVGQNTLIYFALHGKALSVIQAY
jgi:fucose 4-O-acetylase-like acetyltransferase